MHAPGLICIDRTYQPLPCSRRSSVRENHGCKIYFDPVSTAAREVFARELAERVCADSSRKELIATIPTLVYHVAAHEIGHAIYGLDAVQDVIKVRRARRLCGGPE